jgi:hypothetical protein
MVGDENGGRIAGVLHIRDLAAELAQFQHYVYPTLRKKSSPRVVNLFFSFSFPIRLFEGSQPCMWFP